MRRKRNIRLVTAIFMAIALALILPGLSIAGSLEPSDPPGPTMKTLDEIYHKPIWGIYDQVFVDWPDNPRFAVNDNGTPSDVNDDTVLDKETGLVWERNPYSIPQSWYAAHYICNAETHYSGRGGWRLPTIQELASLVDMRVTGSPKLSIGHPFINVQSGYYWSATTYAGNTSGAWCVGMHFGFVYGYDKTYSNYVWCVRGGQGLDTQ